MSSTTHKPWRVAAVIALAACSDTLIEPTLGISRRDVAPTVVIQTPVVAAGGSSTCAIATDGTIQCWGTAGRGELAAPPGQYKSITGGFWFYCAVRPDDTLTCWGDNEFGVSTPPADAFKDVSSATHHNCGIRANDTGVCWGPSSFDRLAIPPGTYRAVTAGKEHGCAVRTDGSIVCWGRNLFGEATAPAGVFVDVGAGEYHTCGLRSDGTLACWGNVVAPPSGTFLEVADGPSRGHSCAIRADQTVACWGDNLSGQANAPPAERFVQISTGYKHTCGVRVDDAIRCWGDNSSSQQLVPANLANPNRAPTANAGAGQTIVRTRPGANDVQLDGSGSSDSDGGVASYRWFDGVTLIAEGPTPTIQLQLGTHTIRLEVQDDDGAVASDETQVIVLNAVPIANAGTPQVAECAASSGSIVLDGGGSYDVDGAIVRYHWQGVQEGTDPRATLSLPLGTRSFTLEVTDNDGATASHSVDARVLDTQAPAINLPMITNELWSPNHDMRLVASGIGATDACEGPLPASVTVTSSDAANGTGDGNTASDWAVVLRSDGLFDVFVRAERSGNSGTLRTYTIDVVATDGSGNRGSQQGKVTVPHNSSR